MQRRAPPARVLSELSRARWSGALTFELDAGPLSVWMSNGNVAWAEGAGLRRVLTEALCKQLGVSLDTFQGLVHDWQRLRLPFADAVLSQPGMTEEKLQRALREHVVETLEGVTKSLSCLSHLSAHAAGETANSSARWSFSLRDVLSVPVPWMTPQQSLAELESRIRGARWVDVVTDGMAVGIGPTNTATRRRIESLDALLLGHADGVELALLHDSSGSCAGLRAVSGAVQASTWVGFGPENGLGHTFMGLQAVRPWLDPSRPTPTLPSLRSMPSMFPHADGRLNVRAALAPALELGEGALGAHVLERDVVCWRSLSNVTAMTPAFLDAVTRASGALELLTHDSEPASPGVSGLGSFLMLDGREGFHVGTPVPGTARTFLFLTFAAGASYGNGVAALSLGARALGESIERSGGFSR
jgi:hypothetical protein